MSVYHFSQCIVQLLPSSVFSKVPSLEASSLCAISVSCSSFLAPEATVSLSASAFDHPGTHGTNYTVFFLLF